MTTLDMTLDFSRKFKAQKIEAGLKVMLYNKFMSF